MLLELRHIVSYYQFAHHHHTLTCCAPHAHPLLKTAMAFVLYVFVLAQVLQRAFKFKFIN
jgi:hypothetical protein